MKPSSSYTLLGLLLVISLIFFALRLYVRFFIVKKPALDDLLVGLGVFFYIIFTGFACALIANGLGTDIDDDPTETDHWSAGTFFFLFSELTFILCSTLLRAAFAVQMLRILLPHRDRRLRLCVWIATVIMVVYSTAFFFVTLFGCQPVDYYWKYMYPGVEGKCINGEHLTGRYDIMAALFTAHSLVCVLSDWILGAVPFFMLKNVQMSARKKTLVVILLSLGILAGVTAVVRAPLIIHANRTEFWDEAVPVAITTAIEPTLGIVAICSATLMPLFKKVFGKGDGSTDPSSGPSKVSTNSRNGTFRMKSFKTSVRGGRLGSTESMTPIPAGMATGGDEAVMVETSWIVEVDESSLERGSESRDGGSFGPRGGHHHEGETTAAMAV